MAELITSEDEANKLVDEIKDYAERLENEMSELMTLTLSRLSYLAHGEEREVCLKDFTEKNYIRYGIVFCCTHKLVTRKIQLSRNEATSGYSAVDIVSEAFLNLGDRRMSRHRVIQIYRYILDVLLTGPGFGEILILLFFIE